MGEVLLQAGLWKGHAQGRAEVRFVFGLNKDRTRTKFGAVLKFSKIKDDSKWMCLRAEHAATALPRQPTELPRSSETANPPRTAIGP